MKSINLAVAVTMIAAPSASPAFAGDCVPRNSWRYQFAEGLRHFHAPPEHGLVRTLVGAGIELAAKDYADGVRPCPPSLEEVVKRIKEQRPY
jgi:hypothetical protein